MREEEESGFDDLGVFFGGEVVGFDLILECEVVRWCASIFCGPGSIDRTVRITVTKVVRWKSL